MTDTNTATDLALSGPTPDEISTALTTTTNDARDRIAAAIQTLAEASDPQDIVSAITHLENADLQIAAISEAIPVVVAASKTLHDIAHTLKAQRDEAIKERDEAQEVNDEIINEAVDERLQWELPEIVQQELEYLAQIEAEDEEWLISVLKSQGQKEQAETLEQKLKAAHEAKDKAERDREEALKEGWKLYHTHNANRATALPIDLADDPDDDFEDEEAEDLDSDEYGDDDDTEGM